MLVPVLNKLHLDGSAVVRQTSDQTTFCYTLEVVITVINKHHQVEEKLARGFVFVFDE